MKFKKTNDTYADLIQKLKKHGYSKSYIARLETEINWLICNQNRENILSYRDACRIRVSQTKSREMQVNYRRVYGILEMFDLYGKYPTGVSAETERTDTAGNQARKPYRHNRAVSAECGGCRKAGTAYGCRDESKS